MGPYGWVSWRWNEAVVAIIHRRRGAVVAPEVREGLHPRTVVGSFHRATAHPSSLGCCQESPSPCSCSPPWAERPALGFLGACRRRAPRRDIGSKGGIGEVVDAMASGRPSSDRPQAVGAPPSACSEIFEKKEICAGLLADGLM